MFPYQLVISLRYAAGKNSSKFVSIASIIGIALGVSALIVVLSVMNGFQEELRRRILGISAHLQILNQDGVSVSNWKLVRKKVDAIRNVRSSAPFVGGRALLKSDLATSGLVIRGVDPNLEKGILNITNHSLETSLDALDKTHFGIVLGSELARRAGISSGSDVVIIVPQTSPGLFDSLPRLKKFHVVGTFNVGMYEYDANLAYIRLDDAQKLYQLSSDISGISVSVANLSNLYQTKEDIYRSLTSPNEQYHISDWQDEHSSLFSALDMEKRVMFVILTLIVAVATFNIISSLIMLVIEKQRDIAVLSTMGVTPLSIMCIFLWHGLLASMLGIGIGTGAGILLAKNIGTIVAVIENILHIQIINKEIYLLSKVPSSIHPSDVVTIIIITFVLSISATLYPSWKATQVDPATILRD
ncbi:MULTISPECIES: lipoprotein-releasing ABC transporter permease subunit [Candidatus Ichthyocystis]|uniref:Putative lipoprotein-releasing system transmembrane protein lolE n=2 Tax=Candidatus Ichthyocystis hellenicum TaxID=1561003 RepID=A0A0S4M2N5_9BURK|nr:MULTISPECIES: lipoprotein-releasing ABC transporter permease subunit [Ichthyocystis]CUT17488.1 putative lipoprotein-releasing system transmembrane protein lolE [Candidatus Ichthyocystis hellenicum]